jgi:class 3 adenylate cyclase/tetratricopeptide (TPR) repeat protein
MDGCQSAHNPKVAGSNPAPATIENNAHEEAPNRQVRGLGATPEPLTLRPASAGVEVAAPVTGTFLFTDLVDSTALASRLGPEAAEELRKVHFGILRAAAEATGGIEVKSTGDGLMLMFTGPSRALSCGVAIQQGIERHNHRAVEPLAVRIGLSMGEANEEDGDYYGDCVVEAARLCAAAVGGQILTTDVLRAVVGRHATQEFAPVGDLELKGLPDLVPTVEVQWVAEAAPGQIPLPGRFVGAAAEGLFGFFGRADEQRILLDAAKRATSEMHAQVVLVAGEPGIGKTTLAAHACRTLHSDGAVVLFGHCVEEPSIPYQPWVEALTHLLQHAPQELIDEHVAAEGGALARLVPLLARRATVDVTSTSDLDGERFVLFEAVTGLLRAVAGVGPLVLVLDDLQWADAGTLQLLRHVLTATPSPGMLVVGTYRDSDIARGHPLTDLLADLRREPNVHRTILRGLDDRELLALMEGAAGYEMPEAGVALAHAVYRETDGNPFFTGELLRHLYETGAIAFDESGQYGLTIDLAEVGLPGSVREVVARRIDRLGEETGRILSLAAVVGREFDLHLLVRIADADEDTLLDQLETATGAALVSEMASTPGRFRFEHALIQHTLYQELGATRRQRVHQQVALALEELGGDMAPPIADLAHHWLAATRPSDVAKALEYARLAGEAAQAALAPEDAIRWFSQALELQERQASDDLATRCDLLIGLGDAQRAAGADHLHGLQEALRLAESIGDDGRVVRSALAAAQRSMSFEVDPTRIGMLEAALGRRAEPSADRARLLAALALETDAREWELARDRALEAVSIARDVGDEAALLDALTVTSLPLTQPDALERRIAWAREAMELADRLGDRLAAFETRFQAMQAVMESGDVAGADELLGECARRAGELALPYPQWQVALGKVAADVRKGDLDAAERRAEEALALANRAGVHTAMAIYGGQLFDIRYYQGRLLEIATLYIEAGEAHPEIESLRTSVLRLRILQGEHEEVRRTLAAERAAGFSYPFTLLWFSIMWDLVAAARTLEDRETGAELYRLIAPYATRLNSMTAIAPRPVALFVAWAAEMAGDHEESRRCFDLALDIAERLESPYWIATVLLEIAERDADPEHARELVERAASLVDGRPFEELRRRVSEQVAGLSAE